MPEILIDQGVKCLNKDIFPHIKTVLDSLNPARSVCEPFINLLTRIKRLEKHYTITQTALTENSIYS